MYTNFAINNNTNSHAGRHQETLKKLAKNVIEQAEKRERSVNQVLHEEEYFTKQYIPAEVYICNISGKACLNNNIENSLKFLNRQATIKNLNILNNPLFYGFEALIRTFTDNSNTFFIICAIIVNYLNLKFIKKYVDKEYCYRKSQYLHL